MILSILFGAALLALGGEVLVRGAVALAARLGVSPLLIGLTVVGFGTSMPEMVTSLGAALSGAPGIAVGNVVGSNIANALLILGAAATISPVAVAPAAFRRDGAALLLATGAVVVAVLVGTLSRPVGLLLVCGLAGYIVLAYLAERGRPQPAAEERAAPDAPDAPVTLRLPLALFLALGGMALTVAGARLLVGGATALATAWGVPDTVIGLTLVALGTSLPELVTAGVAAMRRQGDIALGNVVGSNIYNLLGILGTTAIVHPIAVPAQIAATDIWVMVATTALLLLIAASGWRVTRGEGGMLLALYAGYVVWLMAGL